MVLACSTSKGHEKVRPAHTVIRNPELSSHGRSGS